MRNPCAKINPLHLFAKNNHHRPPSENGHTLGEKPLPKWSLRTATNSKRSAKQEKSELQERNVKIAVVDEDLDLLGEVVMAGAVAPSSNPQSVIVNAKLTSKALIWGLNCLRLDDVVAVSYCDGSRRFTVHSYAFIKAKWIPGKKRRSRKDLHFLATTAEDVIHWVTAFSDQGCFINFSPHPLAASKRKGSVVDAGSSPSAPIKSRPRPVVLVILNPRSGRGRARNVFNKAEAVLKLAGFKIVVVETTSARHAQNLAATVDLSTCPDGIICVGGDGIINEVLNGLLSRDNAQQASQIPIGIIPAGSDNSLVWTVLGIRDPVSAAVAIVKAGMVAVDVFAVEWTKTGGAHLGLTVAYYGFMSDVLELSAKYQKPFGPLRYFVAGALRLLCLPHYKCEIEYLPLHMSSDATNKNCIVKVMENESSDNVSNITEATDSVSLDAANEPSDYVRGLDTKTKRQSSSSSGRLTSSSSSCSSFSSSSAVTNSASATAGATETSTTTATATTTAATTTATEEAVAVHHPSTPSPRPRTRSKSRSERTWSGLSLDSNSTTATGIWEAEAEAKWVVRQGPFLGVMICNHQCKTVQCLPTQMLAPAAEHDDGSLDLIIVGAVGRLQLLRFFWLMQFGLHLSLPYVEYIKVKKVVLKTSSKSHQGCGIDGELLMLNGPVTASLLPYQCRLIGRPRK